MEKLQQDWKLLTNDWAFWTKKIMTKLKWVENKNKIIITITRV